MHLADPSVVGGETGDVADPLSEGVGLGRDPASLPERHLELLLLGNGEDGTASDERARQGVGLAGAVADRDVDRDPPHVGELLE